VRAPWWWFILHGGKDIENRDWPTRVRGRVLIHASKWFAAEEICNDFQDGLAMLKASRPALAELPPCTMRVLKEARGCLVGSVEIVDCVARSESPWFVGDYGFVLRDPIALPKPIPFKGALGFFGVDDAVARELR
jgi:hypothetical protein